MVLVRKLASLYQMEDTKHEQLLMLTFSRAAASEFRTRLTELMKGAVRYMDINTFHSYCFDITGRRGSLDNTGNVVADAARMIRNGEVEQGRITKTVVVIDEAQDMDAQEFDLIKALMERNEDMRVIAVGDDDQNIYEFRNSSSEHMRTMITELGAVRYSMVDNYRSCRSIVNLANEYAARISNRLKDEPICAVREETGIVKLIKHTGKHLEIPAADCLQNTWNSESETAAILTFTNNDALQMLGVLTKRGIPARLIQSGDGFRMSQLAEVKYFQKKLKSEDENNSAVITDKAWQAAKKMLKEYYSGSACLETVLNMLDGFEQTNGEIKYRSDFEMFVFESNYDTFCKSAQNAVTVSTIHKAKGREFDNVYLLLNNVNDSTDAIRRRIYVGMTRAKKQLYVHCNNNILDDLSADGVQHELDAAIYPEPDEIAMQLGLKDVVLDWFIGRKEQVFALKSGDKLQVRGSMLYSGNQPIVKPARAVREKIDALLARGYTPTRAEVGFIVEWVKQETEESAAVILPNIYFRKGRTNE